MCTLSSVPNGGREEITTCLGICVSVDVSLVDSTVVPWIGFTFSFACSIYCLRGLPRAGRSIPHLSRGIDGLAVGSWRQKQNLYGAARERQRAPVAGDSMDLITGQVSEIPWKACFIVQRGNIRSRAVRKTLPYQPHMSGVIMECYMWILNSRNGGYLVFA